MSSKDSNVASFSSTTATRSVHTTNPSMSQISSTSNSTHQSSSSSSGVAVGSVVGAVLGCSIGLALVTFLLTWFFMARKAKRSRRSFSNYSADQNTQNRPTASEKPSSLDANDLARFLPRSLDDDSIRISAFALLDKLDIHVDNFYRNSSSPFSAEALAILAPVASEQLLKRAPVVSQMKRPKPILTYCLAELVTSHISASGDPTKTLLPVDFPKFSTVSKKALSDEARFWSRMLATYLHPQAGQEATYVAQRQRTINALISAMSRAFSGWEAGRHGEDERVRSLTKIFEDAADLGILLYTQPSGFEFHWSRSLDEKLPSLRKVSDEKGGILPKPQTLVNGVKIDA